MPTPEGAISDILAKLSPEERQPAEFSPKAWSHFFHTVEALALILAMAAIYYEGLHANELLKKVEALAANMSTQYIAECPNSLGPISDDLARQRAIFRVLGFEEERPPGNRRRHALRRRPRRPRRSRWKRSAVLQGDRPRPDFVCGEEGQVT